MKRQSFLSLFLRGVGYIVLGNIMCLIATMALVMFGKNTFFNILGIIIAVMIFYMLIFTVAWKDGNAERSLIKHGRVDSPLKYRWLLIGLLMYVVAAAPTVVLLLNKLFFPEEDTLYLYKFISGSAFPFVNTFIPDAVPETDAWIPTTLRQFDNMSVLFPSLMLVYYALIPIVTHIGYYMGFTDKLNTDNIVYK
ncbi:MAG: hypothetical protein E7485_02910 [Ruminococcaceae bacterium]|nr:hypothetical protein [Oscillospiraceae bacterium]